MPESSVTAPQFARPLRIAAAILTLTSVARGVIDYVTEPAHTFVMGVRVAQVAIMLLLVVAVSPRRTLRALERIALAVALVVPLANLLVAPFDLDETWPTVTIVAAVVMGAALFVPWSWRRQATLAGTLAVATIFTILVGIPRTVFPWSDVTLAIFLILATGAGSVWGAVLAEQERRRVHEAEAREIKHQRTAALEGLAGGLAHQFNNILGGILTHASVLRDEALMPQAAAELEQILDAARRGRELTKELLRFTRSEPLSFKPTEPGALVETVAALARASLPDNVAIDVRIAKDLPALHGDADHLVHACLELVFNARDAIRGVDDGRLTLAATAVDVSAADRAWPGVPGGRYIQLLVADTGRGMDGATRDRVFEPFFTTKPMHRAAGMGLAKVYGVVRDHKGSIRVESTPGRGTTISMILPVSVERPAPVPVKAAPAAADPITILVVDDEAIVRHSLRRALTKFGYRVAEAVDGPSALSQLEVANPPVRLVILDLVLPGGGAGILELMRALRPDLKVLVSSGYSPEADTVKDLANRVEGFLPKPYEISELRAAVTKALTS